MAMHAIDIANQRHGAAEVALGHLLHARPLQFFRVDVRDLPFDARCLLKGGEHLVLRDGKGVDVKVRVGRLVGEEQGILDGETDRGLFGG